MSRELEVISRRVRRSIIEMVTAAGSGHPGGSLSSVEVLVALYFDLMNVRPGEPEWPDRDRFILSKGHAAPALYAVLAERGFIDKEILPSLRKLGSPLQGHPDMRKVPGVEASTGSLGQGLSMACGMALAYRLDRRSGRIYVLLGDGEADEGQVWEAAMAAAHFRLDNLTAFLDLNGLQIDGRTEEVMRTAPLGDKFRSFGWEVFEVPDGNDIPSILSAAGKARSVEGRPAVVILKTVKGKGVSYMEDQVDWHGKAPAPDEAEKALAELEELL